MCGICGVVDWQGSRPIDVAVLKQMVWRMRHRGPDEYGLYVSEHVGLGHARLSIIDPEGGSQPMTNEDGSLWIVFNGEIYNHVELRPGLEGKGHRFSTRCDTEVILHLYEEYGPRCLDHMNGQFAFAIWDASKRRVFMARDRFGIRPLYYTTRGNRLLFASEVKSLLAAPEVDLAIDPLGLDQAFTFWSPLAPRTAFKDIHQLPAGHCLTATPEDIRTERYWNIEFPAEGEAGGESEEFYVEGLREELIQATRLRMRADVPVAAYLSGGLDSSLTTAIIKKYTDAPLNTFSIRFSDAHFDEGPFQDEMVTHLGTDHRSVTVATEDIASVFPEVVWHAESPILRSAPVPLHSLSGLVRDSGIKVVVTGEGADEVLAGYNIFKESKIRRFWARHPNSRLRPLLLSKLYPYVRRQEGGAGDSYWQRFFAKGLTDVDDPCYSHLIRWGNATSLKRFFSAEFREQIGTYDGVAEYEKTLPRQFGEWDPLSKAQYIEMTTFMSGYLLSAQGDRVSSSHGVEGRFPFLDHHVTEFAAQIPPNLKLRVIEEKYILRQVARDLVPSAVRDRVKQPYRAPESTAFFTETPHPYVAELLSEEAVRDAGCFDAKMVARLRAKCEAPGKAGVSPRDDMALLGILSTQLLHDHFVKRGDAREPVADHRFCIRGPASGVQVDTAT